MTKKSKKIKIECVCEGAPVDGKEHEHLGATLTFFASPTLADARHWLALLGKCSCGAAMQVTAPEHLR